MSKIGKWVAGIAAAFACASAGAAMHQICYEGPLRNGGETGIWGCTVDGGGYCTMTPLSSNMFYLANSAPGVQTPGYFWHYDLQTNGVQNFAAKFEFFDTNNVKIGERQCTISAGWLAVGVYGGATSGSVLTGFSTDQSGLVTTGVWRAATSSQQHWNSEYVTTPADFVAVGGGAMGVETPVGALINGAAPAKLLGNSDYRSWQVWTSEGGNTTQLHVTTGYVIGLHIEGIAAQNLANLIKNTSAVSSSTSSANPSATATPSTAGMVVIGGGTQAYAPTHAIGTGLGQFLTASAPVANSIYQCYMSQANGFFCTTVASGWYGESKDHMISDPGFVMVQVLAMPSSLTVGGTTYQVASRLISGTSIKDEHPSVDVSGLRGDYALTSVGAVANWHTFPAQGNLLWHVEPREDLGGASVASKDHVVVDSTTITGYALGIKLYVPASPPILHLP
ncbi:MAG TPA: hypothetical protein VLW55_14380 [Burkholderiaceae bacterium]|nr:hypothetical protein [Burkholderiaceae bacterium]